MHRRNCWASSDKSPRSIMAFNIRDGLSRRLVCSRTKRFIVRFNSVRGGSISVDVCKPCSSMHPRFDKSHTFVLTCHSQQPTPRMLKNCTYVVHSALCVGPNERHKPCTVRAGSSSFSTTSADPGIAPFRSQSNQTL
jgi:hypothetical protein